jgi:hypothetical protein
MALVLKDRVKETTITIGTSTLVLLGATSGFQSFSVIGDGNTTYYTIDGGNEWEVGIGTYTLLGTTLSRDTILESSNGGSAVNFNAGTKNVFVTYPAERALYTDASSNAIALGTPASATLTNATGLPISTGVSGLGTGVATFLATPSSANLASAVTDETGSGSLVFATSPTLVTPALGTPSSGTLTNCTFPTLNQNTTGSAATVTGNATGATFGFDSGYGSVETAYGCRAWVNFNGTANSNLTGTYSQTGTTVTVTITAHGYVTGQSAYLDFTSGTAVDGTYTVTVTDANTFTLTQASRTTSGNVTNRRNTIRASGNVTSVTDNGTGDYTVNFTTAMTDVNYSVVTSATPLDGSTGPTKGSTINRNASSIATTSVRVVSGNIGAGASEDMAVVCVAVFR